MWAYLKFYYQDSNIQVNDEKRTSKMVPVAYKKSYQMKMLKIYYEDCSIQVIHGERTSKMLPVA